MSEDKDWNSVADGVHREWSESERAKSEDERLNRIEKVIALLIRSGTDPVHRHSREDYDYLIEFMEEFGG